MRYARPFVLAASLLSSGCMLPRPIAIEDYTKNCIAPGPPPPGSILFLTTRLPDCRGSDGNKMTWHRGDKPRYGVWAANGPQFFGEQYWKAELARQLAAYREPPILYLHGYNNRNEETLARAAAIRLAAGNHRPVIALTWPSYASESKYFWDEANAEWTVHEARALLAHLDSLDRKVVLVAHSMGNRLAVDLVRSWRSLRPLPIEKLIMASPDVDRAWFARELQNGLGIAVTLYGSTYDQALSASWRSHGYPRAGDLSNWVTGNDHAKEFPYLGLDGRVMVVDTSVVRTGKFAHADFIESIEGAADLCRVITGGHIGLGRADTNQTNMKMLIKNPGANDPCAGQGYEAARYLDPKIKPPLQHANQASLAATASKERENGGRGKD